MFMINLEQSFFQGKVFLWPKEPKGVFNNGAHKLIREE
jgi:hypothetical protein